jgi:hypothetical protein
MKTCEGLELYIHTRIISALNLEGGQLSALTALTPRKALDRGIRKDQNQSREEKNACP